MSNGGRGVVCRDRQERWTSADQKSREEDWFRRDLNCRLSGRELFYAVAMKFEKVMPRERGRERDAFLEAGRCEEAETGEELSSAGCLVRRTSRLWLTPHQNAGPFC